jgi:Saxitoxin biosynthesis operon protein SxtJ
VTPAKKPSASELRLFGLALGAAFLVFFGLIPILLGHRAMAWPFGVTAGLWTVALVAPTLLGGLHIVWTRLGHALGWFNTRVTLAMMFFLWVVPAGIVMRLLGRDKLGSRFDGGLESYRVAGRKRPPESMERPY